MAGFDVSTTLGRIIAYLDFWWNDHAYLRAGWANAHWLSDELVRTNQPWPFQLAEWRRQGIRTVVNLRGPSPGSHYALEKPACEQLGLTLVDFVVISREPPTSDQVLGAKQLFETIEYPAVMHCKSGADRAGIMSVLYLHFRKGKTIREALSQLSLRYGHFRQGLTGVLDYTFERYLEEGEPRGVSFLDWVQSPEYDPKAINGHFRANWWGTLLTDKILRRE